MRLPDDATYVMSNELAEMTSRTSKIRSSRARFAFANNSADMTAFYSIHQHFVKIAPDAVKKQIYLLNKATYVLVASLWEAYCEDVLTESLTLLVDCVPTWKQLPQRLARDIAKELRKDETLLAPWALADDGWRQYVKDRQLVRSYERNYDFSGPKSANVERYFSEFIGVADIRDAWRGKEGQDICLKLDKHLDTRNSIVHQISPGPIVFKREVKDFYDVVRRLIRCTDQVMDEMLKKTTGKSRWISYVKSGPVDMVAHAPVTDINDEA